MEFPSTWGKIASSEIIINKVEFKLNQSLSIMTSLFLFQKHGIILNSETATNGETSDTLNSVGYPGPTKMTKEELNALKATGDGTLGKSVFSCGSCHLQAALAHPHCIVRVQAVITAH